MQVRKISFLKVWKCSEKCTIKRKQYKKKLGVLYGKFVVRTTYDSKYPIIDYTVMRLHEYKMKKVTRIICYKIT